MTPKNNRLEPPLQDLLEEYRTTAEDALSPEETLRRLRDLGMRAMIDAESGLWINEMCMGQYNSIYAQNRVRKLSEKE